MGKIIVEAPAATLQDGTPREIVMGVIAVNPNKPEFGNIQLRETSFDITSSFSRVNKSVHFLPGRVEDLKLFVQEYNLTPGCDLNQKRSAKGEFALKIKITENTTPSYDSQEAKINPTTGEVITHEGQPVYRHSSLVALSDYTGDELLQRVPATIAVVAAADPLER